MQRSKRLENRQSVAFGLLALCVAKKAACLLFQGVPIHRFFQGVPMRRPRQVGIPENQAGNAFSVVVAKLCKFFGYARERRLIVFLLAKGYLLLFGGKYRGQQEASGGLPSEQWAVAAAVFLVGVLSIAHLLLLRIERMAHRKAMVLKAWILNEGCVLSNVKEAL